MAPRPFIPLAFVLVALLWLSAGVLVRPALGSLKPFFQNDDFRVYFTGDSWVKTGLSFLQGGYAEYPPLGLTYLSLPKLVTRSFTAYSWVLRLANVLGYVAAGWLTLDIGSRWLARRRLPWWLWLLPSAIFFSLSWFDILPVLLALLALWCMLRGQVRVGWLWFGLAVAAKLYPIFLLPLLIELARERNPARWWYDLVYAGAGWLGPTLGVALSAGWAAALSSYFIQASRGAQLGSGLWLLGFVWHGITNYEVALSALLHLTQLALPAWWFWQAVIQRRVFGLRANLTLAGLTLLILVGANPFYSNQWWLWALPFVVWCVDARWAILPAAYDVVNYIQYQFGTKFEFVFPLFGPLAVPFILVVAARVSLLILLIAWFSYRAWQLCRQPVRTMLGVRI